MFELIFATIIAIAVYFFYRISKSESPLKIKGKLIWVDEGKDTKSFFHNKYRCFGKPDFMYKVRHGILAVEFKSRYGRIYDSDIIQAKCAALAARGSGYQVSQILVITSSQEKYITLPKNSESLYREIEIFVALARKAKLGHKMKAEPDKYKCSSCAFKRDCNYVYR